MDEMYGVIHAKSTRQNCIHGKWNETVEDVQIKYYIGM